jgi:hypothetical protein
MKITETTKETNPIDVHQMVTSRGIFNIKGVAIPEESSKQDWAEIHRTIILCCIAASRWKKQSRLFSSTKWDLAFAADTEVQIEMDLGVEFPEEKPRLNPADKSTGITTIEATNASFIAWERKMHDEIPTWDDIKLRRALELLEPMEKKAAEIRQLISAS